MAKDRRDDRLRRDVIGIGLAALGALLLVSLFYGRSDSGILPYYVAEGLKLAFGVGAYLTPVVSFVLGVLYMLERRDLGDVRTAAGLALLFLIIIVVSQLAISPDVFFTRDAIRSGGGYVGAGVGWLLLTVAGRWGSYIVMMALGVIAALLVTRISVGSLVSGTASVVSDGSAYARRSVKHRAPREKRDLRARAEKTVRRRRPRRSDSAGSRVDLEDEENSASPSMRQAQKTKLRENSPQPVPSPSRNAPNSAPAAAQAPTEGAQLKLVSSPSGFVPPPLALLHKEGMDQQTSEMRAETAERIIKLEDTLESFGINAKVTHYECGPVLTRYEIEPERGIRVNQITRLADDLAMSLAAVNVRVEAPIPGKSAIGIEVPNQHRALVSLRGVMESEAFRKHKGVLPIALGRDIAGQPIVADLVPMPHLLIAGATGAGKSICLHSVILSLIMTHAPPELKLIIIDPKRVELAVYDGIPHLMAPVVYSVKQAADVLHKAIKEMEKRYDRFALKGASNIAEYNELARISKQNEADEFAPLARVVIVIDELADLMMQARAEFEYSICRVAQLARATGIHLVVATQRPATNIITGNIKANMPSRIAFAVPSLYDSRTILDMVGAERLIGAGDMLYAPLDAPKPRRVQGSFVRREDITKVVANCCDQGEPEFEIIPYVPDDEDDFGAELEASDELFNAAVEYIINEQQASVSMLQRRFKIGYARAGRLIDMMEQRGIVGPHEGSKPREVLGSLAMLRDGADERAGQAQTSGTRNAFADDEFEA